MVSRARRFPMLVACGKGTRSPPLLFIVAMDTLTAMFLRATELEILSTLSGVSPIQRLSIFTDDVVLFIRPSRTDLTFVGSALEIFGEALGLSKFHKIFCYPNQVQRWWSSQDQRDARLLLGVFPCKHLGLQRVITQLTRAQWQPMLDCVSEFVPA